MAKNYELFSFLYSYLYKNRADIKVDHHIKDSMQREKALVNKRAKIYADFKCIVDDRMLEQPFHCALQELGAINLEKILFQDHERIFSRYFQTNEAIIDAFDRLNHDYNIFPADDSEIQKNYILLHQLCTLIADFFEKNNDNQNELSTIHAYKLLSLFQLEHNKINPFIHIENYIKSLNSNQGTNVTHDALAPISLPKINDKIDLAGWQNFIKKYGESALKFFANAEEIEKTLHHVPNSMQEAYEALSKLRYINEKAHPELARECIQLNLSESFFETCLKELPNLSKKKTDTLPDIQIDGSHLNHPGYHLVKLPIGDFRAIMLGKITNCCQSIDGHSKKCVIDGMSLENNGFYVLLKKRATAHANVIPKNANGKINYNNFEIVGQGYAWRSLLGNIVFDSWENKHEKDDAIIVELLTAFGKVAIENKCSTYGVFIGKGGKTPHAFNTSHTSPELMLEGSNYGDANSQACIVLDAKKQSETIQTIQRELVAAYKNTNFRNDPQFFLTILQATCALSGVDFSRLDQNVNERAFEFVLKIIMQYEDLSMLKAIVESDAISAKINSRPTLLMKAVREDKPTTVRALINAGANINSQDSNGETALMCALQYNHDLCAIELLEANAQTNIKNNKGRTALYFTVLQNNIAMLRLLCKYNADVNVAYENEEDSLIFLAATLGYNDVINELIKINIDININAVSSNGVPAISYAAYLGRLNVLTTLIQAGAKLDIMDCEANTALIYAAMQNELKCVTALIKAGAKLNIPNKDGNTALMRAAQRGNAQVVDVLIEAGACLTHTNNKGQNAYQIAIDERSNLLNLGEKYPWSIESDNKKRTNCKNCADKLLLAMQKTAQADLPSSSTLTSQLKSLSLFSPSHMSKSGSSYENQRPKLNIGKSL